MYSFGSTLTKLRNQAGLKQSELSELFSEKGNPVSNQAISKWEKDASLPNATQLITLCEIYGGFSVIQAFLPEDTSYPIAALNKEGCAKVLDYISLLKANNRYIRQPEQVLAKPNKRTLHLFDLPVSAGTGELLLGESYEDYTPTSAVPEDADFCLRISGDSMEPHFHDGQIVYVHQQPVLNDGDIGIFGYDGHAYCKKLSLTTAGTRLISLNEKYDPIEILRGSELLVFGRVVEI